jgi:hypothetical protein
MARIGGRMVLVGIQPGDNGAAHQRARRKAITMARCGAQRMSAARWRWCNGLVQIDWLVAPLPLEQPTPPSSLAADYADGALRVAVEYLTGLT